MPEYQFTFVTTGLDTKNDRQMDALEETFDPSEIFVSHTRGRTKISFFSRKAPTALDALQKAYKKLKKALPKVQVEYVDEDLVSIPDIAGRTSLSKKEIRAYANDCDNFPAPVGVIGRGKRVWRWQDAHKCLDAVNRKAWADTKQPAEDYTDGSEGEYVDRQSVALFMVFVGLDTKRKLDAGHKKPVKRGMRTS